MSSTLVRGGEAGARVLRCAQRGEHTELEKLLQADPELVHSQDDDCELCAFSCAFPQSSLAFSFVAGSIQRAPTPTAPLPRSRSPPAHHVCQSYDVRENCLERFCVWPVSL